MSGIIVPKIRIINADNKKMKSVSKSKSLTSLKPAPGIYPKQTICILYDVVVRRRVKHLISDESIEALGIVIGCSIPIMSSWESLDDALDSISLLSNYYDIYIVTKSPTLDKKYTSLISWFKHNIGDNQYSRIISLNNLKLLNTNWIIRKTTADPAIDDKSILFGSEMHPDWKAILKFFKINRNPVKS